MQIAHFGGRVPMAKYVPSPRDWVRERVELYENSGGTKGTTLRDTGLPVVRVTHWGNKRRPPARLKIRHGRDDRGRDEPAERLGCGVIPVASGMTERQVQLILDFQPDIIIPTPSYLLVILDEFRARGLDPSRTSLKIAFCGAEPWTNSMRAEIEGAFDIHALDTYGLSELIGPGVASECVETKDGLYVWEDHFYPEVIDPKTGQVLPDGERGEIVFTSLTKEAMPIIRYRTHDLTRLMPGRVRTMRRMEKVTGRSDDMIVVRGVNVFPTQIEEQILRCEGPCTAFHD